MNNPNNIIPIKGSDRFVKFLKKLSLIPILIILGIIVVSTMVYQVEPEEDAVILRFGKYNRTEGSGLHFKWPFDLETYTKVPVRTILKVEFGFKTESSDVRSTYSNADFSNQTLMLTGDLNVIDVSWIVQYRINNARNFLFNVNDVPKNLFDISQAVMREVIGDRTITECISESREEIANEAMKKMQTIFDQYNMGIDIVIVKLQDVFPPDKVRPSFDDVNAAVQDARQIANIADKQKQKLVQEEKGKAEQTIKNAEAYKIDLINRAKGDASRFSALYEEYKKAPDLTKKRLYFDAIKEILGKTEKVYIVDPEVKSVVPFLNLSQGK